MAVVKPFRAVRYGPVSEPLEALVAPPYDVIDDAQRRELLARSPHNVVHLTLPDSEDDAARAWRAWQDEGALVRDREPTYWALAPHYVGPDGVARTRTGLVAALRVEPYERRVVLPHERTHRGAKEGRLRLLRAVRAQLEPIFLLHDGSAPFSVPERGSDLAVEGAHMWRVDAPEAETFFAGRELLIADGHHRYETALAYHEEAGSEESAFMLAVLVSTDDPGLTIFPTHRVFATPPPELPFDLDGGGSVDDALAALADLPPDRPGFVLYERGEAHVALGREPELDVQLVDRLGHEGLSYTPDRDEAVRRVDAGEAAVACLLRPTRIEDVFEVARRGQVMPQKTTYFYPKLVSGLLFLPVG